MAAVVGKVFEEMAHRDEAHGVGGKFHSRGVGQKAVVAALPHDLDLGCIDVDSHPPGTAELPLGEVDHHALGGTQVQEVEVRQTAGVGGARHLRRHGMGDGLLVCWRRGHLDVGTKGLARFRDKLRGP